jgi:hypothetical protein
VLNIKHFTTSRKLQACCIFVSPQEGKDSYDPCYIWDIDYSTAAYSGHGNVSRACTQWQFDTTELGETITGKVNILTLNLLMSCIYIYIYIYMELFVRSVILTSYVYGPTFGNAESRLFLFAAQCFNTESMQKVILWHSCV